MLPLFGLLSVIAFGILALCIVGGATLCASNRRTVGTYVLAVPTLSALAALAFSWGPMRWVAPESRDEWQGGLLWVWPIGFAFGAIVGALLGIFLSILLTTRHLFSVDQRGVRGNP